VKAKPVQKKKEMIKLVETEQSDGKTGLEGKKRS
jgi:hypothetical protein